MVRSISIKWVDPTRLLIVLVAFGVVAAATLLAYNDMLYYNFTLSF